MTRKRVLIIALFLALMASVFTVPGIQLASAPTERLANGGFEEGFAFAPVGVVGMGWHWFDNGGSASYTYHDDTWAPVVYEGQHAQLIEIDTTGQEETERDRYAGIYQTVAVVPGETYELSLRGMLRGLEGDPDLCCNNYTVQVAVDHDGGADWTEVDGWVELPWDTVHPRLSPGPMESYSATIQATGSRLTLFIRLWKKWATVGRKLDLNLDAISLKGAEPADRAVPSVQLTPPDYPVAGWTYSIPVRSSNDVGIRRIEFYDGNTLVSSKSFEVGLLSLSHRFVWRPQGAGRHTLRVVVSDVAGKKATARETVGVGAKGQFLQNGSFEEGFSPGAKGMVGEGWAWFDNGGEATYRFDQDSWTPVVYDGTYSQFIEINTVGFGGSEPVRRDLSDGVWTDARGHLRAVAARHVAGSGWGPGAERR
jgi:hypothetical protein